MNPDRFKRRTDYSRQPPRRVVPVRDELGELRQLPLSQVPPSPPDTAATPVVPLPPPAAPQPSPTLATTPQAIAPVVQSPPLPPAVPGTVLPPTISVNISLPKVHLRKPKLPKLSLKPLQRLGKWPLIAIAVVVLLAGCYLAFKHFRHVSPPVSLKPGQAIAAAALAKPTFTPAAPKEKPGLAIAKAGTSAFDGTRDSYSYQDTLSGTAFVVSEQPLPSKFSTPDEAVAAAAQSIGAKTPLAVAGGTAYMLADAKSGSQTLVFSVKGLLAFIQSPFTHPSASWVAYIDSLD